MDLDGVLSSFLRGSSGKSAGVSALVHVGALAVLAHPWLEQPTPRDYRSGPQQTVTIEASFTEQPQQTSVFEVPIVEIQPGVARVDERRFVDVPATAHDWDLDEFKSEPLPAPLSAAKKKVTPQRSPVFVDSEIPPVPRTRQLPTPEVTASVPPVEDISKKTPPKFIDGRPPRYPELAVQRDWEGTVLLQITIDATGKVSQVEVRRSSGYPILDAAAVNAVRSWKCEPARRDGNPVEATELLPVQFRL